MDSRYVSDAVRRWSVLLTILLVVAASAAVRRSQVSVQPEPLLVAHSLNLIAEPPAPVRSGLLVARTLPASASRLQQASAGRRVRAGEPKGSPHGQVGLPHEQTGSPHTPANASGQPLDVGPEPGPVGPAAFPEPSALAEVSAVPGAALEPMQAATTETVVELLPARILPLFVDRAPGLAPPASDMPKASITIRAFLIAGREIVAGFRQVGGAVRAVF